jgi:hypothetical protein
MKLRHLVVLGISGLSLAAGCDKKAEPAAVAPVAAEAQPAPETAEGQPASAEAPVAATAEPGTTAPPTTASDPHAGCGDHAKAAEGTAAADPHAGCGEHDKAAEGAAAAADPHAGCGDHAAMAAAEGDKAAPTGEAQHLGETFTLASAEPLGQVLAKAQDGEATVRVDGTIAKVCQKKGCWMVVRDGDLEARVVMKDYGFFVPMDAAGKKASIEGVLKVKVFNEAQAKHLAEDGGEDPNAVTGEKKEFLLTASAIDIVN